MDIEITKSKCWEHEVLTIQQIVYVVHKMYRVKKNKYVRFE